MKLEIGTKLTYQFDDGPADGVIYDAGHKDDGEENIYKFFTSDGTTYIVDLADDDDYSRIAPIRNVFD